MPPDLSERLLLDQATDFSYVISAIAVLGMSTIALIFFDFSSSPAPAERVTAIFAVCLCYFAILFNAYRWLRRPVSTQEEARTYIATMSRILSFLGIFWSCLLVITVKQANPGQLNLLYGIMAGCLATPVMVSPALCAFAFWMPVSAGICLAVIASHQADLFAVLDLLSFIGLTGFCILYLNRRMNERAVNAIKLEETAEVIRLLLRDFEENASDWLWETNADMELQQVSQRLAQVSRRPAESLKGPFPAVLLGKTALDNAPPGSTIDKLQRAITERSPFRDLVIPLVIEGEQRYWSLTGKPIVDKHGNFSGYHGVGSDITGQRRQQEHISFLARHDSLTKLANRMLFSEVLHQCCDNSASTGFALLCLDLDNFKIINDTLGHATGDAVLVAVAERLRGSIREFDIAARLGGDEFAIIVITNERKEAEAIAKRIVDRILRPFQFDGQMLQTGVSIGIAMAPEDGNTPAQLMKSADLALYRAKSDGRGIVRVYDQEMDEAMQARRSLQAALRQAITRGELSVAYQPIVNLTSQHIIGAEALVRWRHPEHGFIPPAQFIPLAEECGLIEKIGTFVLRTACAEAASWPGDTSIAINLSPQQSNDTQLVHIIADILATTELPPDRLELEIVETTMLETGSPTEDVLWQLHRQGVKIVLDDFGTGYSSLSYLRRFPFSKVKIDRSFVCDLGYEKADSSIILAIIGIAETMNMQVTAEGVETQTQANLLRAYGCPQAQGFLFHEPMEGTELAKLLTAQQAGSERALPRVL
ncbi:diguanylate cyclase/phosphodiesterase [Acidocella aminolytica 101 = DSM 11237]|uniref:Diguanylate cyclase/phosphodiesterase n=2 Tax=Acidocella TaxID=50709 RepID=A0A0D6PGE1_9PROT|nr:diguanylate cyclase/phosphodiesterase [Acidocella aminolytica 101 = DSM 11237]